MNDTEQMTMERLASEFMKIRSEMIASAEDAMSMALKKIVTPSEVVQEAYLAAAKRLADFSVTSFPQKFKELLEETILADENKHCPGAAEAERHVDIDMTGFNEKSHIRMAQADPFASLHKLMEELPPDEREILNLRHFQSLNIAAAAKEMHISTARAKALYARALMDLKAKMGPGSRLGL